MKRSILLAMGALLLLVGCGPQGNNAPGIPVTPKWKGATYHISLDTKAVKPAKSGVALPGIKFDANPDALETRAILVVRFDSLGNTKQAPTYNKMIMSPTDISGAQGSLPADYVEAASHDLSSFLTAYCVKGKIKLSVAMARSSLTSHASDDEVNSKLLSDWLPIDLDFKNPKPGCKG